MTCGNCLLVPGSTEEAAAPGLEAAEETCPPVLLGEDSHTAPRRTAKEDCLEVTKDTWPLLGMITFIPVSWCVPAVK